MEWNRPYEDDSVFVSIVQTANGYGYFAVGGFSYPSDAGAWFVRLDSSGNILWNSTSAIQYGKTSAINVARSVIKTSDGGYAVVGALNSTVWLVKFAPDLATPGPPTPEPTTPEFQDFLVFVVSAVVVLSVVIVGVLVFRRKKLKT
jgi:hypothetical protein